MAAIDPQKQPQVWAGPPYMPDVTQAQAQAASAFSAPPQDDAVPSMRPISMPGPVVPAVFSSPSSMPTVRGPVDPLQASIDATRARLSSLTDKDERPWGFKGSAPDDEHPNGLAPNHPGFMGRVGHVLGSVGNIAGTLLAPEVMAQTPGTDLNRSVQENSLTQRLQSLADSQTANRKTIADTAETQDKTAALPTEEADASAQSSALTRVANARADALLTPKPTNEFELWHQQNPNGTAQDFEQIQKQPLLQQDADARNAVWDPIAPQYHLPTGQFRAGMSGADATALATAMNQVVGRNQGGTKIVIERDAAANGATKTRDAATEKEFMAAQTDLGKQFETGQKQDDTLAQAQKEINSGAVGQAVGTIKTLVGLAGGQGTGVRITQPELNGLANARGLGGDFEGYFNGLAGQGNLSDKQKADMTALLGDVANTIKGKMALQDQYLDKLNTATSPAEVRAVQSEYRKALLNGGSTGPKIGEIRAGADGNYRFKGGDQYDQKNWEKVAK